MAATERALIDAFTRRFPLARTPRGPGDDCAVLPRGKGRLCVTTDAVVEGVHFTRASFTLEDVGHKALAVNLSDLAAMGARPAWAVCALGLPPGTSASEAGALGRGMAALAEAHRVALAGGNITRAPQLSLTLTVAGHAASPLLRSAARPGDLLYVSGTLGDARAGLEVLRRGAGEGLLARRQRRPTPRIGLGRLAGRHARAAMDLSDGLQRDLAVLCEASKVGAEVALEALPLSSALVRHAGSRERAARLAAVGGEDYELLLAVAPAARGRFERACATQPVPVTCVGRLGRFKGVRFLGQDARPHRLEGGFDHFEEA